MSEGSGELVPLRRPPVRRPRLPTALVRRGGEALLRSLRDPRATAVVAVVATMSAERGLRRLTARLPVGPRSRGPEGRVDGWIDVEWVGYVVRLTGRAPSRR